MPKRIPTRGFLITTRKRVVVSGNRFLRIRRTEMHSPLQGRTSIAVNDCDRVAVENNALALMVP